MDVDQVGADAVREELRRVLSSADFSRNDRQSQFLRFLVERQLEGRGGELKESVIGVEVFGRRPDYDPKIDAIVRTEAIRLRARLRKYYAASSGRDDAVLIELPKGGYRPAFRRPSIAGAERKPHLRHIRRAAGAAIVLAVVAAGAAWWVGQRDTPSSIVAVLPMENIGNGPDGDLYADGLTDDIIRALSVVEGLTVRSRTSSFALKGKRLDTAEAGKKLKADYLLAGSLQRAGDKVRVTAQLISVRDDSAVWSGRFVHDVTDVFAIQNEISRGIANSLHLKISSGRRRYETNLQAYELYVRGRHAMTGFPGVGRRDSIAAVQYFERAIAKDPGYALAYAGIADTFLAVEENIVKPEAYPRAKVAAEKAMELDPMLSEAQSAWASLRAREYAWGDAERGFRRAIELNPNNALARVRLGLSVLAIQRRYDEGLIEVRRAVALDPLSPNTSTALVQALLLSGRYAETVAQAKEAIALDPTRNGPYVLLARALSLQGKTAEAVSMFQNPRRLAPPRGPGWQVCALERAGMHDEALAFLRKDLAVSRDAESSRLLGVEYACVGDKEPALDHLEKAVALRMAGLAEILRSPELVWMHPDPRFAMLLKAINLTP